MRRLSLGLPTALQVAKDNAILFHEHGTSKFQLLGDPDAHMELGLPPFNTGRVWALVDSNNILDKPAPVFRWGDPFFVVNAASPRQPHLEWTKKINSQRFYMKPWTFSEVLEAHFNPPSGGL